MNRLLDRFREALDAPRFCSGCGAPIEAETHTGFDAHTGAPDPHWYWRCPKVSVDLWPDGSFRAAEWYGRDGHVYGIGRPRWHRLREGSSE